MKKLSLIGLSVISIICSHSTIANNQLNYNPASEQPIVKKITHSGYVMPEYQKSVSCNVYRKKVTIETGLGYDIQLEEHLPADISKSIEHVMAQAAQESETHVAAAPCDGPSTKIYSYYADQPFTLVDTGDCTDTSIYRVGPMSDYLIELAHRYCP